MILNIGYPALNRIKLSKKATFIFNIDFIQNYCFIHFRLHSINPKYPDSKDAIPMVSKLEYDDKCDKVLRYIFGRTLISRNLEIATKMSQEYHFDCVTLDGDQVN